MVDDKLYSEQSLKSTYIFLSKYFKTQIIFIYIGYIQFGYILSFEAQYTNKDIIVQLLLSSIRCKLDLEYLPTPVEIC